MLDLMEIEHLTGGKLGTTDSACPICGPLRRSAHNRKRKVLRIWREAEDFASYHCARCDLAGHTRDPTARPHNLAVVERLRAESAERERQTAGDRLELARWLWSKRAPIAGTVAERYLRRARGYAGAIPQTLGFLPARGDHGPALMAAFGMVQEPEPSIIEIAGDDVRGVHIVRLHPDGLGKAGTEVDKISIGPSCGFPIVLAPANDLLGMVIAEGIEDALSAHAATGLGAWAVGGAKRLPPLAAVIPSYIEAVTIIVDDDPDGRRYTNELSDALRLRGMEVHLMLPDHKRSVA